MTPTVSLDLVEQIAKGNSILWWGWDAGSGPAIADVVKSLTEACNYPSDAPMNLPIVASYYQDEANLGRQALIECLRQLLEDRSAEPDLAEVVHLPFSAIITPRLDNSVERTVQEAGLRAVVIVEDEEIPFWDRNKTLILKPYGSLERPGSLTLTQDDYDNYSVRKPLFSRLLHILLAINHTILLEPWLDDPNFRRIYQEVRFHSGRFQRMRYALVSDLGNSHYWLKQGLACIPSAGTTALRDLVEAVAKVEIPISSQPVVQLRHRPYKFLDYYTADDKDLFFGRNQQIRQAGELVLARRLVVLYGWSGVGKTSLLLAGLIPAIAEYGIQGIYVRCGTDPEAAIRNEVFTLWPRDRERPDPESSLADLLAQLSLEIDKPLTVFVDQFEEFSLRVPESTQHTFVSTLGEWWGREPIPARIVLSVREDYLGILDRLVPHVPSPLQITFKLRNLSEQGARLAIEQPAAMAGLCYESSLVDRILRDLRQTAEEADIVPPQLQIVCSKLYDELASDSPSKTLFTTNLYQQLGGAEKILADYVDDVLDQFTEGKREKAKEVLKTLVSAKGERRLCTIEQVAAGTTQTGANLEDLLRKLIENRLIRRIQSYAGEQFEVIHDYLASKIVSWIDDVEQRIKEIQELLERETSDRESYGSILTPEKYKVAYEFRKSLMYDKATLELLLASALYHNHDPSYWFNLLDTDHGPDEARRMLGNLAKASDPTVQHGAGDFLMKLRSGHSVMDVTPLESISWVSPSLRLLTPGSATPLRPQYEVREAIRHIEETLHARGVQAKVVEVGQGPAITQYRLELKTGVTVRHFLSQESDLGLAVGARRIRLLEQIPGTRLIGIEIPNPEAEIVNLRNTLEECSDRRAQSLPVALGKTACGTASVCEDLSELVHVLVAGGIGSGKTMLLKAVIASLLLLPPTNTRFLIINSRPGELFVLDGAPHLIHPVVQEPKEAVKALRRVEGEIQHRQNVLRQLSVRTFAEYRRHASSEGLDDLPYWVVVIDDYENVVIDSKTEVHRILDQVTKIGRLTGLHLVVSTKHPLASVIPTAIKSNFPSRVAFLQKKQDAKLIFDEAFPAVEKLLGKGDMFLKTRTRRDPERLQSCFISDEEINLLSEHWQRQLMPTPESELELPLEGPKNDLFDNGNIDTSVQDSDELLARATEIVQLAGSVSISMLRRELDLSSLEAIDLLHQLQGRGIL